jgi:two-component system CheB/CheR fusion protein
MESQPIRVLLAEDDEDDYLLARDLMEEIPGNPFHMEWASTYDAVLTAMERNQHDAYLLDYRLGHRNGLELLREAQGRGCQGPVILLTGQGDHDVDMEAMRAGVVDYLVKGQIDAPLLERSIRYAVERHRDRQALREAHDDLERRVQERTAELARANAALLRELNERCRAEAELRKAEESLKEADRRKDEFLAMLAHELRNPLAPIGSAVQVFRLLGPAQPELQWAREVIERQLQHITRLVDDLLDVSRITRGKIKLQKETVEVASVVARAVEAARPFIDSRKHELTITQPAEPIHLEADATRLAQIVANLLHNAAKYSEEGERIWLTVDRRPDEAVIKVRDTGMGIPADMLPRVFDLFSQADHSLDRSQGGLGIGLTLVRSLAEMHGGGVQAFSDGPGRGSEFVLRLPASAAPCQRKSPSDPAGQGAATVMPRRILVVDDHVDAAEMLAKLLQLEGHDVRTVHDGTAALEAAQKYQPEVILLDIGLPGMNGYEVARQLRQQPAMANVLLVAVTGYGQEDDRRRSKMAGFDYHLVKPLTPNSLEHLLANTKAQGI